MASDDIGTVYAVSLSVVITLSGEGPHTKKAILENVGRLLESAIEGGDDGDSIIDNVKVIDVGSL